MKRKGRRPIVGTWSVIGIVVIVIATHVEVSFVLSSSSLSSKTSDDNNNNNKPPVAFPLLDFFFPSNSLASAWERYPLLSQIDSLSTDGSEEICTGSNNNNNNDQENVCTVDESKTNERRRQQNKIPTVNVPPTTFFNGRNFTLLDRIQLVQSFVATNNVFSILFPSAGDTTNRRPPVHSKDWKVVRKIESNGREWAGQLPSEYVSTPSQLQHAFSEGGFSIVINELQKFWTPVQKIADLLQQEISPVHVSCNMYLTPPPMFVNTKNQKNNNKETTTSGRQAAFEPHWDWMDVIVVQIVGEKVWSVSKRPHVELSTSDQKYSPNQDDIQMYLNTTSSPSSSSSSLSGDDGGSFNEILMKPGNIMYIPRGYIHNASTVHHHRHDDHTLENLEPSLHLTFGIEYRCVATIEALVHHAIELYSLTAQGSKTLQLINNANGVAISAQDCPLSSGRDIPWKDVLHFAVAATARSETICSQQYQQHQPQREGRDKMNQTDTNTGFDSSPCFLRQSVPFPGRFKDVRVTHEINIMHENTSNTKDRSEVDVITSLLDRAFDIAIRLIDVQSTATMVQNVESGIGENIMKFCHPYLQSRDSTIPCPEAVLTLSRSKLISLLNETKRYAVANSDEVLLAMNDHMKKTQTVINER